MTICNEQQTRYNGPEAEIIIAGTSQQYMKTGWGWTTTTTI